MSDDRLRIGVIAPPWVPVPPPVYGGTELVIDHLARGLIAAGHDVDLFTTGDATCPVERHWLHRVAVGTTGSLIDELGHVQAAYAELAGCDVIHDHTLLGPMWAITNMAAPPVVTTAHGPFTPELSELYRTVGRDVAVVAISHHQRDTAPEIPVARVIHHGLDMEHWPVGRGDGGYLVFLGRMHPDKGVHRAIRIARAAGKQLRIAAKMWEPAERRYFAEEVEPLLGSDAVYLGEVGGRDKVDLLAGAEALLNPIRWPEPFGLVMIEALAVGTPVVTFGEGAAPEIVDDGVTGFVCRDEADMVDRLADVCDLDRRDCRRAATSRFSARRMVDDHVALYQELVEGRALPSPPNPRCARRLAPLPTARSA
jgi:glycosyltransferase involved in cell wall biosynthesis